MSIADLDDSRGEFHAWCNKFINPLDASTLKINLTAIRKERQYPAWLRCLVSDIERKEIICVKDWISDISVNEISDVFSAFHALRILPHDCDYAEKKDCLAPLIPLTVILMELEMSYVSKEDARDNCFILQKINDLGNLIHSELKYRLDPESVQPTYTFN